jgi:putative acetyltransferase
MIRYARPADHAAIAAVVAAAFGREDEARLVARLRTEGDAMFELVAEEDGSAENGGICGHILFSRLWADHHGLFAALAPLAVQPGRQRAGVGSELVRAGLASAREFGCHGVLVLGDPAYYGRFGFSADHARDITSPFKGLAAFQALPLEPDAFARPLTAAYPDAFGATSSELPPG